MSGKGNISYKILKGVEKPTEFFLNDRCYELLILTHQVGLMPFAATKQGHLVVVMIQSVADKAVVMLHLDTIKAYGSVAELHNGDKHTVSKHSYIIDPGQHIKFAFTSEKTHCITDSILVVTNLREPFVPILERIDLLVKSTEELDRNVSSRKLTPSDATKSYERLNQAYNQTDARVKEEVEKTQTKHGEALLWDREWKDKKEVCGAHLRNVHSQIPTYRVDQLVVLDEDSAPETSGKRKRQADQDAGHANKRQTPLVSQWELDINMHLDVIIKAVQNVPMTNLMFRSASQVRRQAKDHFDKLDKGQQKVFLKIACECREEIGKYLHQPNVTWSPLWFAYIGEFKTDAMSPVLRYLLDKVSLPSDAAGPARPAVASSAAARPAVASSAAARPAVARSIVLGPDFASPDAATSAVGPAKLSNDAMVFYHLKVLNNVANYDGNESIPHIDAGKLRAQFRVHFAQLGGPGQASFCNEVSKMFDEYSTFRDHPRTGTPPEWLKDVKEFRDDMCPVLSILLKKAYAAGPDYAAWCDQAELPFKWVSEDALKFFKGKPDVIKLAHNVLVEHVLKTHEVAVIHAKYDRRKEMYIHSICVLSTAEYTAGRFGTDDPKVEPYADILEGTASRTKIIINAQCVHVPVNVGHIVVSGDSECNFDEEVVLHDKRDSLEYYYFSDITRIAYHFMSENKQHLYVVTNYAKKVEEARRQEAEQAAEESSAQADQQTQAMFEESSAQADQQTQAVFEAPSAQADQQTQAVHEKLPDQEDEEFVDEAQAAFDDKYGFKGTHEEIKAMCQRLLQEDSGACEADRKRAKDYLEYQAICGEGSSSDESYDERDSSSEKWYDGYAQEY